MLPCGTIEKKCSKWKDLLIVYLLKLFRFYPIYNCSNTTIDRHIFLSYLHFFTPPLINVISASDTSILHQARDICICHHFKSGQLRGAPNNTSTIIAPKKHTMFVYTQCDIVAKWPFGENWTCEVNLTILYEVATEKWEFTPNYINFCT